MIHRLLAGYCRIKINDDVYYVMSPSVDVLYEAAEFYAEIYEDNIYNRVAEVPACQARQGDQGEGKKEEKEDRPAQQEGPGVGPPLCPQLSI